MFRLAPLFAVPLLVVALNQAAFHVVAVRPDAAGLDPAASLHVRLSEPLAPASLTRDAVRLLDEVGRPVECTFVADLGTVLTVTPVEPLRATAAYTLELTAGLLSVGGAALVPHRVCVTTGEAVGPGRGAVRFRKDRLDTFDGASAVCVGPDGHLYAATFTGCLWRYRLDPATGRSRQRETVAALPGRRILGLAFDPDAPADRLRLWMVHDGHAGEARPKMSFSGVLSRWDVPAGDGKATETPVVVGFPVGAHPVSSPVFGPDGRLYLCQAAVTMAGASTDDGAETPLSAAILAVDVRRLERAGGPPLDVRTGPPANYDPTSADAPVRVYAHGVREAFDLCWHSNGNCYAATTMNDTPSWTPSREGVPALFQARPDEALLRLKPGVYYGFPNPAVGRHVLLGGNPTAGKDPWEVAAYPVGVRPEADFQPGLLLYNLATVGGDSANGCVEYRRPGPWRGRLLVCFYATRRAIGSFAFSRDGGRVVDFQVVRDRLGREMKFASPLDVATDAAGRLYVADFSADGKYDSGKDGGLWLLTPADAP